MGTPVSRAAGARSGTSAMGRVWRGAGYLLRGARLVAQNPGLLRFFLLPLVATAVAFCGVCVLLYVFHTDWAAGVWTQPESGWGYMVWYAWSIGLLIASLTAAYLLFLALQGVVAGPFNEALSVRVERMLRDTAPEPSGLGGLLASVGLAVVHELRKLLLRALLLGGLFVVSLIVPVVGAPALAVGGFYATARFVAFDALDFTMARRLWGYQQKWRLLREHRALTLGFGAATTLLLLVPVLGLAAMPLAAVGGTLLFVDVSPEGAPSEAAQGSRPADVGST